jgi:hypothetical protein
MAEVKQVKQNGVVVSPSTGSGNTTLQVRAEVANRGNRLAQTATFEVEGSGVAEKKQFVANRIPAEEFIEFDNASPAVDKGGGSVTLTGKSNTTKITFSKGAGDIIGADISAIKFTANGASATSGIAITGDPGAKAKYNFSVTLTAAENETIEARTQQVIAIAAGGQKAMATLNQTAGDPFIEVTPTEIDVPQDGSAVQVTVDTNTAFTVTSKS